MRISDWSSDVCSSDLATVRDIVSVGKPAYGINTGFGKLAKVQIPADQLEQLQANLVRSHAAGVGELLDDASVRLIFALKIASLSRGYSGVRCQVLETLIRSEERRVGKQCVWPCRSRWPPYH